MVAGRKALIHAPVLAQSAPARILAWRKSTYYYRAGAPGCWQPHATSRALQACDWLGQIGLARNKSVEGTEAAFDEYRRWEGPIVRVLSGGFTLVCAV